MKRLVLTLVILAGFALGGAAQSLHYDFEDGTLQGWTTLDVDGDEQNWEPSIGGMGHNSNGMALSYSRDFFTGDPLTPNEYLVSPRVILPAEGGFSFWACAMDEQYCAEHFAVAISTTVNDDPMAFTTLEEWTLAAKGQGNRLGNWFQYAIEFPHYGNFAGQEVYVAIRHFNCSGQSAICVDDITIEGEIVEPHYSLWKPLNLPGTLLGVNAEGYIFSTNYDYSQSLMRSHDDGETWETVFNGSVGNLAISNEGRIFVFNYNTVTVMYSDDNGDTWQQTTPISSCGMMDAPRLFATTNDIIVGWTPSGEIFWTLDGGDTWDGTILEFMEEHQEIKDLLVSENGDVYVSVWYYIGPNIGVYHSTLSDMQNWEIAAFEDVGITDMAFDPEGNIVCGVNFGGEFSGFEHVPGFYAFWANRVAVADNGIVYKTAMTMYDNAVLAYSLDHGEHFYNTVEGLPLSAPAPGGEDGFLSKDFDNHLYFLGNGQYWKSIPNADDIPNVIAFPSEWYYEIENENGSITYQHLYQAGDTIVNDEPTHILVKINTLYDKGLRDEMTREYVYLRDGKVYWWNKTLEEFTVLYDFGAQQGDSWIIKVGTESLTMQVDAVEEIEYEGKTYRMLRVSDPEDLFSGNIVCGIGHLTSFFPERLMDNSDGMRVEGLRCYWIEDELVFQLGDEDCDAVISELHGIEEDGSSTGSGTAGALTVYPNPTNGVLFVETHGRASLPDQTYRITNLMGQTLMTGQITSNIQQIDVSTLPQGMYFINIGDMTREFVVNR